MEHEVLFTVTNSSTVADTYQEITEKVLAELNKTVAAQGFCLNDTCE